MRRPSLTRVWLPFKQVEKVRILLVLSDEYPNDGVYTLNVNVYRSQELLNQKVYTFSPGPYMLNTLLIHPHACLECQDFEPTQCSSDSINPHCICACQQCHSTYTVCCCAQDLGQIDGVLSFWELSQPLVARLAEHLGLPGNPPAAVDAARDKQVMC